MFLISLYAASPVAWVMLFPYTLNIAIPISGVAGAF
jgi:hypothetical protein